jgi:hypothetical protein
LGVHAGTVAPVNRPLGAGYGVLVTGYGKDLRIRLPADN